MKHNLRAGLLAVLGIALAGPGAWRVSAQTMVGSITGTVRDSSGASAAVVPNAVVRITNEANGAVRQTLTDVRGDYRFDGLFIGSYRLQVEMASFKKFETTGVEVKATQLKRVDVAMELGDLLQTVHVEETAPAIQTESPSLFVNMPKQALDRPLTNDSRGWVFQSLGWLPGSAPGGSWLLFGPGHGSQQEFAMEGSRFPQLSTMMAENAVSEMQTVVNNAPAEYARPVSVNVSLKSGTNQLHGELEGTLNNNCFNAVRTPFYSGERSGACNPQLRVLWGAGGPVFIPKIYDGRNKTFWRISYHKNKDTIVRYTDPVFSAPTQRMLQGDFSRYPKTITDPLSGAPFPNNVIPQNRIVGMAQAFIKDAYGTSDTRYVGSPDSFVNNVQQSGYYGGPMWQVMGKADQIFRASDVINFSYHKFTSTSWQNVTRPAWPSYIYTIGTTDLWNYSVGYTHTFSPAVVNQLRLGLYRSINTTLPGENTTTGGPGYNVITNGQDIVKRYGLTGLDSVPALPGRPSISITGWPGADYRTFGGNTVEMRQQIYENLSWTKGRHSLKFGYNWYRLHRNDLSTGNYYGAFSFNGAFTSEAWADFLLGYPQTFSRFLPRVWIDRRITEHGFYAQDDWRITPRLVLYYGLRYGRYTTPYDRNGLYYNFDVNTGSIVVPDEHAIQNANPNYPIPIKTASQLGLPSKLFYGHQNLVPRIGFAWRPTGSADLVVRGGYGVYTSIVEFAQLQTGGPFGLNDTYNNTLVQQPGGTSAPRYSFPNYFAGGGSGGATGGLLSVTAFDSHFHTPYVQQYQLSVERSVLQNWGLRLSYMGSKSTQLTYSANINTPRVGTGQFSQATRPYANFNNITYGQNGGNDYLQSLEFAVTHPFSKGLWFQAAYTYRYSRSDVGFEGFATAVATPGIDYAYDRSRDKGRYEPFPTSDFVANWVYEAPIGRGKKFDPGRHGVAGKILNGFIGDWAASGVLSIRGGLPFTVFYSNQDPGNINQFTGRPNQVPGCNVYEGQSVSRWFNPACFTVPAPGTLGNFERNSLIGPGGWTVVLNPYKDFPIPYLGEATRLRIGANIYNLFNHPVYGFTEQGGGVRDITNPAAGRITGLQNARQPFGDMSGMRSIMMRAVFMF